jgi:hypothetical protein
MVLLLDQQYLGLEVEDKGQNQQCGFSHGQTQQLFELLPQEGCEHGFRLTGFLRLEKQRHLAL